MILEPTLPSTSPEEETSTAAAEFEGSVDFEEHQVTRLFAGTPFDRPPRCERCGELEVDCNCPPEPPPRLPPDKQTARLSVEKRKKGKVVTLIRDLSVEGNDLPALLTTLKNACGAGGALKDGILEIQGRHLERVREVLAGIGYRVKG